MTRLHLPHAIVVRLHTANIVILTLETAGSFGVWARVYPCRQDFTSGAKAWMLPSPRHSRFTTKRKLSFLVFKASPFKWVPQQISIFIKYNFWSSVWPTLIRQPSTLVNCQMLEANVCLRCSNCHAYYAVYGNYRSIGPNMIIYVYHQSSNFRLMKLHAVDTSCTVVCRLLIPWVAFFC